MRLQTNQVLLFGELLRDNKKNQRSKSALAFRLALTLQKIGLIIN